MKLRVLIAVVLCSFAVPTFAQRMLEPPPPAAGNVTLSLDEYNRLLALANRPGKAAEAPPLPYVLNRADLKMRVTSDDVLGSIQIEGETLGSNSTKVPLTTGMTILEARQGSRPLPGRTKTIMRRTHLSTSACPATSASAASTWRGSPVARRGAGNRAFCASVVLP